jgi:hypothetical protein
VKFENLRQPPFETSLMGVLRGVCDHYGIEVSDAGLYGASGHAFLVNVHEAICPSGPYCWNPESFRALLANLGIQVVDLGFFHAESTPAERADVERRLRAHMEDGQPCSVCNMDHQLIGGFDYDGLHLIRPWPGLAEEITPARLTFRTWSEFGSQLHASFFTYVPVDPKDGATMVRDALRFAVDVHRAPAPFELPKYGVGPRAWDNWLAALPEHGATHGNWWNATVWGECRARAGEWFAELAAAQDGEVARTARELSAAYADIAGLLEQVADKERDVASKADLVVDLKERDAQAVAGVERLLALLPD